MSANFSKIIILLLSLFIIFTGFAQASPDVYLPIITSDPALSATVFATNGTATMDVNFIDGRLHVSDYVHGVKDLRVLESMLYARVDGYNGKEVILYHVNDAGVKDSSRLVPIQSDGTWTYFYDVEFSEVIIDGFVGTWEVTAYNLSVSDSLNLGQEFNASNVTSLSVNITDDATKSHPYDINTTGLVGWWKLDDDYLDSSGNGNNGTAYGDTHFLPVKYDNGSSFGGTDDYINAGSDGSLNVTGNSYTLIVDVDITQLALSGGIMSIGTSRTVGTLMQWGGDQIRFFDNIGDVSLTKVISKEKIYHVVVSYNNMTGNYNLYVDNIYIVSDTGTGSIFNKLTLGRDGDGAYFLNGSVDNAMLYMKVLTESERNNLYYNHLQQLQIKTNSNSTYSTPYNSTTDNPINVPHGAGELFSLLNFTVPDTVVQNGITIYDYSSTVQFDTIATVGYTEDITKITESAAAGTYTLNITHAAGNTGEGYINYTTANTVLLDADFWNSAVLTTDNPNATLSSTLPCFNISTGYVPATTEYYYLITQDYFYPPTNLVGINGTDNIILDWADMPNSDNYSVYKDGVFLINVTASNHTLTGLTPATEYNLSVTTWNGSQQTNKASTIITTDALPTTSASSTIGSTARGLISSDNETLIIGDSNAKYIINSAGLFNIIFDKTNPNNLITKIIEWSRSTLDSIKIHSPGTPQERSTFWTIVLIFSIILFISGVTDKNPKVKPVPAAAFGFILSTISVFYLGLFSIVI